MVTWNSSASSKSNGHAKVPDQRVGPLSSIPELLTDFGVSIETVTSRLGISSSALSSPDAFAPYDALAKLLEACAQACRCPHFGLLVGAKNDHRALGLIGQLMATAPSVGDALFDFVRNQHRNSRGAAVYLMRGLDAYFFGYAIYNRQIEGSRHVYDLCLALGMNALRALAGLQPASLEVLICHEPPQDVGAYSAALGPNVRFNQSQAAIVLSPAQLRFPVVGSNAVAHRKLAAQVDELLAIGSLDLVSRVRHVLKPNILLGRASREAISEQAGLHVRTLHRRLRQKETSYRALEQEVKFAVACELLEITDLEIADISAVLNYSSPSSFDRAFARWTGRTPSEWRKQNVAT